MSSTNNGSFRDEKDWKINREKIFFNDVSDNLGLIDEKRKVIVYVVAELHRGRHSYEVYDISNCSPKLIGSSDFEFSSYKQAALRGLDFVDKLPMSNN